MAGYYNFEIVGLENLSSIDELSEKNKRVISMVLNAGARRALAEVSRQIRTEVNLPREYLSGAQGKLRVTKYAAGNNYEAAIGGSRKGVPLARFAPGLRVAKGRGKPGITVRVKPGSARFMKGAFPIKFKSGGVGIAIRLPVGQVPKVAHTKRQIFPGVWLLSGPSVDQAFIGATKGDGVAPRLAPDIAEWVKGEYKRLMELDL